MEEGDSGASAQAHAQALEGDVIWPSAPVYDLTRAPTSIKSLDAKTLDSEVRGNFWRSARWCADGSAILSTTEDRALRMHFTSSRSDPNEFDLSPKSLKQPDAIHSTLWYPTASAHTPETFCFAASIRDTPVRLIDANDGRIRATYPIVDHRERFIAPHSLAFNHTATKLYCGFENAIEVFDVASPGYDTAERLKTVYAKKEKGGQKGIISALAFCTDYAGTFAAGSYSSSVALYSEDTGATPLAHVEGLKGGGVTQIAFHPLVPTTLYIASRRSSVIQTYDTRDLSCPVTELARPASTNQRIWFDIDPWGRWLTSGDEFGTIRIWDITNPSSTEPLFERKLHDDAVSSVQFHPYQPLLLTSSGSRAYLDTTSNRSESDSDSDNDSSDSDTDIESQREGEERSLSDEDPIPRLRNSGHIEISPKVTDATLRIWSMSSSATSTDTNGLQTEHAHESAT